MVGQHTLEVMAELGYDESTIEDYRSRGIVSWPGENYPWPV